MKPVYDKEKAKDVKIGDPCLWYRKSFKDDPDDVSEGYLFSLSETTEVLGTPISSVTKAFWEWPDWFKLKMEYELYVVEVIGRNWNGGE